MEAEEEKELARQSALLESLEHTEGFRIWRKEVCDAVVERLEAELAASDSMSEQVLRAKVQLKYLLKDCFYGVFERVKAVNDQENTNK